MIDNSKNNSKNIYFRCDDNGEMVVFSRHDWTNETNYEFTIEDSYCGGDYMGIKGRFKRAWKAFWKKPICYTGVYCEDKERMKKFLKDCLSLIEQSSTEKSSTKEVDASKECNHDWTYSTEPTSYYDENGELYYRTKKYCSKCGATETKMHIMSV